MRVGVEKLKKKVQPNFVNNFSRGLFEDLEVVLLEFGSNSIYVTVYADHSMCLHNSCSMHAKSIFRYSLFSIQRTQMRTINQGTLRFFSILFILGKRHDE